MQRALLVCIMTFALFWVTNAQAADMHQGKVVGTSVGKLTMTDLEGKNQHTMDIPTTASVTREGKTVMLTDLKAGDTLTISTEKKGDVTAVIKVEAKSAGN